MGAPQYEQAGADVAGSGTPGTIPVWSSGTTLGNSALTQNVAGTGVGFNVPAASVTPNTLNLGASRYILIGDPQFKLGDDGFIQSGTATGNSLLSYYISNSLYIRRGAGATPVMTFDASSNVGIGTASPGTKLDIYGANVPGVGQLKIDSPSGQYSQLTLYQGATSFAFFRSNSTAFDVGSSANIPFTLHTNGSERARIDSSGRLLVGTATSPSLGNAKLCVAGSGDNYIQWSDATANKGFVVGNQSGNNLTGYSYTGAIGSESFTQQFLFDVTNKCLNISAIGGANSINGLKLPATPGNADTQTLDCYQETTWAPTLTGFGGTNPTVSTRVTRVGRLVTLNVQLSATGGAQFSSTAGSTYLSLPAGMTPALSAAGGASDAGIGALNPCVAFTNGNLYVPTFALRTTDTFLTVTYAV